ncbi:MAG: cation-transporting P-type ATPase, partial [Gammaproteobacteria bacterium]|nr:cation-transporting P-type ATPase [Gammaproteobacteria bacterium]
VTVSGTVAGKDFLLMVQTGLALAVAAIPEGLPVVATIALARGMQRMARRHALINRLSSVETLGATGVIFTDKTGTLTENRMTATTLVLASGEITVRLQDEAAFRDGERAVDPQSHASLLAALEAAVLCNDAALGEARDGRYPNAAGDPLEIALLRLGAAGGLGRAQLLESAPERREEAFDADVRMMATFHEAGDGFRLAVKGAPEAVIDASTRVLGVDGPEPLDENVRADWLRRNEALAANGQRVIALAERRGLADPDSAPYEELTLIGLVGLEDPPRADVAEAIARCREAGITVIMVTGDQAVTARSIAEAVGLVEGDADTVVHGADMRPPHLMSRDERERQLAARVFARVNPRQKLDLIELHQDAGHIVAMTGDGVNDAPALEKADIGVAMGLRGTQVAQEAADMVLQDDAFPTIVAAVREGRVIFANIRSFVLYLMSCNVSEVMVVGLAAMLGGTLPILPLQILFLNLVTDVFPALALGVSQGETGIMQRRPRHSSEPILGRQRWGRIVAYGAVFTGSVLGALWLAEHRLGLPPERAVTVSFLTLALAQLWHVFNMRSDRAGVLINEITGNPWVWAALGLCSALIVLAVYLPLPAAVLGLESPGAAGWSVAVAMSLLPLLFGQAMKSVLARRQSAAGGE